MGRIPVVTLSILTFLLPTLANGAEEGKVGIYRVDLELNPDLPTNPTTQCTIAQDVYVSNIVVFPLFNPIPPEVQP